MKEFNYELAKQGKPVCTRDGRRVEIFKFDARNPFPIFGVAIGNDTDYFMRWNKDGTYFLGTSCSDLMMASEKHEGWVNLYNHPHGYCVGGMVCKSFQEAKDNAIDTSYITTVKIEWEE